MWEELPGIFLQSHFAEASAAAGLRPRVGPEGTRTKAQCGASKSGWPDSSRAPPRPWGQAVHQAGPIC